MSGKGAIYWAGARVLEGYGLLTVGSGWRTCGHARVGDWRWMAFERPVLGMGTAYVGPLLLLARTCEVPNGVRPLSQGVNY